VSALHVHGRHAVTPPPPRLLGWARHDLIDRQEPARPIPEARAIEGSHRAAAKLGIGLDLPAQRACDRHRVAEDHIAGGETGLAAPREAGHEESGRPRSRRKVEAVETRGAGAHGPDGQGPPEARREAAEQPTGL
jgi:hypothetical protein